MFDKPTPAEKAVQDAINNLWYNDDYKGKALDERNRIAEAFLTQYYDSDKIKVDKPFLVHPATRLKQKARKCTVAEILADYIMGVSANAEKGEVYPVESPDKAVRGEFKRKEVERALIFEYDYDDHILEAMSGDHTITEWALGLDNSVEAQLFANVPQTVVDFRRELERVKANPLRYATKFEALGYNRAETVRRIRRLDMKRVRECVVCGNAFYAHDTRRVICDMQQGVKEGGDISESSTCELIASRKRGEEFRQKRAN